MQTVLITGGTGMIGQALTNTLIEKGYKVIVLTRNARVSRRLNLTYAVWDISKNYIDPNAIQSADMIIHLAGESVATKRWTKKRKEQIVQSRVQSGALLVKALMEKEHKVKTVITASAIGWYGPDTEASLKNGFKETDPSDDSYLSTTCKLWEESIYEIARLGIRLVTFRIGIVFNKRGGAFAEFLKPAQFGMATILGTGTQLVSWIHQQDLCKMIVYAAENVAIQGVYNAVAPSPVSNKTLTQTLAKVLYGKFYITTYVPSFILKIMLGEMSIEVLKSTTVSAQKIQNAGFVFDYPEITKSLSSLDL